MWKLRKLWFLLRGLFMAVFSSPTIPISGCLVYCLSFFLRSEMYRRSSFLAYRCSGSSSGAESLLIAATHSAADYSDVPRTHSHSLDNDENYTHLHFCCLWTEVRTWLCLNAPATSFVCKAETVIFARIKHCSENMSCSTCLLTAYSCEDDSLCEILSWPDGFSFGIVVVETFKREL